MKPRIVVLASGNGTTCESFIRAIHKDNFNIEVGLVISSRKDAGVLRRISNLNQELKLNIESTVINHHTHPAKNGEKIAKGAQTLDEEKAILDLIKSGAYKLVVLMGYMKKVGPKLVNQYGWQKSYSSIYEASMLNTHPGILPDTKAMYGEQIQSYVLNHHLPYGGQSLHIVSIDYDDGPIIAEHRVPVKKDDTPGSLFKRVQEVEKSYLPSDIDAFLESSLSYNNELNES